jgi:glycosyltransferase involved in cell wall biosynthesis
MLSRAAVAQKMASPGIRAYQIAGALGRALPDREITLAVPANRSDYPALPPGPNVKLQNWSSTGDAVALARSHEVSIARDFPPQFVRLLGERRFALDAFTPLYIEWMELSKRDFRRQLRRRTWMSSNRWYLNFQLTMSDFMFCADERQRDMWIGMLMALALVPPDIYERDPSLRRMIDIVPYGVSSKPLAPRGPVLKGVIPGIEPTDKVLLWNGGITEWNDPLTLLQAMNQLITRRPNLKLVFMGVNHPDYAFGPESGVTRRAVEMANILGLTGRTVFFQKGWVPYERIDDYLAEADASVCLGYETVESRFAFRTRYVDCFRARIPLLCTRGDVLAERVESDPLGITVPEQNVDAVVAGIERLIDDTEFADKCRARLALISDELSWDIAVEPLVRFCRDGESWATPADRRKVQAYGRSAVHLALKTLAHKR